MIVTDDEHEARIEEQLRVKIGEAKNIYPRNGSFNGFRDVYCGLCLDKELIFRTCTIEKTLNPFFAEEFQFEIPRPFRAVTFYLYDRSINYKDKVLGKVAIKKDDLTKFNGKDHWFAVQPVDADSEVEGKISLELRSMESSLSSSTSAISPTSSSSSASILSLNGNGNGSLNQSVGTKLCVRIVNCSNLAVVNGSCDPFVVVSLYQGIRRLDTRRTKIKKKTTCPTFGDYLYFDLPIRGENHDRSSLNFKSGNFNCYELRISVMHDVSGVFGNAFLGQIKIPLSEVDLRNGHKAWYLLQPREAASAKTEETKVALGSLRLKLQYTSDYVLSSRHYDPLRNLILKSLDTKSITSSAVYIMGEIVSNKLEAAQPLVKIFVHYKRIISFIGTLAEWEISKVTDPNTIFRGNTLVSKCLDELMKLVGMRYLHDTLQHVVNKVIMERKRCEIDPGRLRIGEGMEENMKNLKNYINCAFDAITQSAFRCPKLMSGVFGVLKELALKYFPDSREISYSVISGFVFLRFFAPAILNPKLFDLTDKQIDAQTYRTLTLISKTVQSIGNLVSSKCLSNQVFKEDYMARLYKSFVTQEHIDSTRKFLELISSSGSCSTHNQKEIPAILKESYMIKRTQGRKRRLGLGLRTGRKRYFCLTTEAFYYSKGKKKPPLNSIPISNILAVERLQEESFKVKNMFQVVQLDRALYIQANNCVEEKEWMDILGKVCQTNMDRLKMYHPAAYIRNQWLCCRRKDESAPGCSPVSVVSLPPDIGLHIDPDREVARIHAIFVHHMKSIIDLHEWCRSPNRNLKNCFVVTEEPEALSGTLEEIRKVVSKLDLDQKQYMRRVCVRTIYGSEEAPIGDDNYLMMLAKHCTTN